jgi:hypothetical protein
MASKVYIPQQPSKYDYTIKDWVPIVNMQAAKRFGEFIVMLPPNAARLATAPLIVIMKEKMANYKRDDYLVAIGDPSLIAAAAIIAYEKAGLLRLLKWDRQTSDYIETEIRI